MPPLLIKFGTYLIPNIFDRLYGSFELDNKKTLNKLDFRPPFSTEEGIEKMVLAFKQDNKK
jgi:nucleoside-diphosphate-sugar epimerase